MSLLLLRKIYETVPACTERTRRNALYSGIAFWHHSPTVHLLYVYVVLLVRNRQDVFNPNPHCLGILKNPFCKKENKSWMVETKYFFFK
jgi:hypothetical protein